MFPLYLELGDVRVRTEGDVERLHVFGMVVNQGVGTDTADGEGVPHQFSVQRHADLNFRRVVTNRIHCATRYQQRYCQS